MFYILAIVNLLLVFITESEITILGLHRNLLLAIIFSIIGVLKTIYKRTNK